MNLEELFEEYPHLLKVDGFDDCIIGVADSFSGITLAYDQVKVIEKLKSQGMSNDDALDYYYFNIIGSHVGEYTPVFIELIDS